MNKHLKILVGALIAFFVISCSSSSNSDDEPAPVIPVLTTTAITSLSSSAAASGGTIDYDGDFPITARGVVWSTNTNPTIDLPTKTSNGSNVGSFSSSITGLVANTLYYVRAYATNSEGTYYGSQISFTTLQQQQQVLVLGQSYQGGKIVYLFKSGDAGYDANIQHGFIANSNVVDNNYLEFGCINFLQNNTSINFGSGGANTQALSLSCLEANTAITFCNNFVVGTYTDWFLPSKNELIKLAAFNAAVDDIYFNQNLYVSSSEVSTTKVWAVDFSDGTAGTASQVFKNDVDNNVCPIRKF
ncbi:DUF1566 domain-containing protein [Flavobacterium sp.]|uniref:DUF1566 domain-containing protein n=1 Tax=Flavobacterium sp. TaxID=239 RepID=UPI00286B8437|nr:DUF1566 domain-containing protein [Flavobacterium sp.]